MRKKVPTTRENVASRLFLRFFLICAASALVFTLILTRGFLLPCPADIGTAQMVFILAALGAAFLNVSKPYLCLLCVAKTATDLTVLARCLRLARAGAIGLLPLNGAFLLVAFSLLLFCAAASEACYFAFCTRERDLRLFCSRGFLRYLPTALILSALAFVLRYAWETFLTRFSL